jgi:hypothetical protein
MTLPDTLVLRIKEYAKQMANASARFDEATFR